MRKIILLLAVIVFLLASGTSIAQNNNRQRLPMDLDWRFSQTDTVGAFNPSFNDSKWRTLDLPHDWSIENEFVQNAPTGGGGGYLPTGIGW